MRNSNCVATAAIVVVALLLALPPRNADAAKLEGRNVKIGCLVPLTGKGAEWGQTAKISMEMAVEEINANGGIGGLPIDLICYDTQTLEPEGLKAFSRLVERDKVLAISGPCFSSVFETIAPQLDRLKTVINSYCSAKPGLSAMSKWAFRNTLTSDKQLKPVVAAWVEEYHPKKVVIIYDAEDAVSKAEGVSVLPALFKAHGIEVLESLSYRTNDTDYSAQVTSAPGFIEIAGKAAEGTYMSTAAWIDDPRHEVQAYLKKFMARNNGKAPPYGGPRAYDIIYSYKHCFEKAGITNRPADLDSDRDKIRECLGALKQFPGVAGEITMDENRDGAGASAVLKVVNGKYVNVAK